MSPFIVADAEQIAASGFSSSHASNMPVALGCITQIDAMGNKSTGLNRVAAVTFWHCGERGS